MENQQAFQQCEIQVNKGDRTITAPRKSHVCLLYLIALSLVWGAALAASGSVLPQNEVLERVESKARRLMHELK
jgi:hypothetical protein